MIKPGTGRKKRAKRIRVIGLGERWRLTRCVTKCDSVCGQRPRRRASAPAYSGQRVLQVSSCEAPSMSIPLCHDGAPCRGVLMRCHAPAATQNTESSFCMENIRKKGILRVSTSGRNPRNVRKKVGRNAPSIRKNTSEVVDWKR